MAGVRDAGGISAALRLERRHYLPDIRTESAQHIRYNVIPANVDAPREHFSLQVPAVALTYSLLRGVACAQSFSTRKRA